MGTAGEERGGRRGEGHGGRRRRRLKQGGCHERSNERVRVCRVSSSLQEREERVWIGAERSEFRALLPVVAGLRIFHEIRLFMCSRPRDVVLPE